jgi:hypothetical protein
MFSGIFSSFQSLLAQPALLAMGAGLLAGAVTGTTLVVTGILPDRPDPQLTILSCYDNGKVVGQVKAGQAMLVTARSADGTWLEVYVGLPGAERGWAPRSALRFEGSADALPIVACIGFIPLATAGPPATSAPSLAASALPSGAPSVAPTIVATVAPTLAPSTRPSATPKPTRTPKPTATPLPPPPTSPPTPTPAPTADVFAPSVSAPYITSPGAYINGSYYINADYHCAQPTATIRVNATDPSGLTWVRLYYRPPGGSLTFTTMSSVGGGAYQAVIAPNGSWLDGEIGLWGAAQDIHGNTSALIPFGNPNSNTDVSLYWSSVCLT